MIITKRIVCTLFAVSLLLLGGCANWKSIYRSHDLETRSLIIDAKQRVVLTKPRLVLNKNKENEEISNGGKVVCAEPSPDIAQAMSFAVKLALDKAPPGNNGSNANLALNFSESIIQLGERLAVIQLFRDRMYRACEAYANGAIDRVAYTLILARNDKTMATLLSQEIAAGAFGRPLGKLSSVDEPTPPTTTGGADSMALISQANTAENIYRLYLDDPDLEPLLDACLTSLAGIKLDSKGADRVAEAKGMIRSNKNLEELEEIIGQDTNTIDFLQDLLETLWARQELTNKEKSTAIDLGVEPSVNESDITKALKALKASGDGASQTEGEIFLSRLLETVKAREDISEKDKETAIDLGVTPSSVNESDIKETIKLSKRSRKDASDAKDEVTNAELDISTVLLQKGNLFAQFCMTEVFGPKPSGNGFISTMIKARKELRKQQTCQKMLESTPSGSALPQDVINFCTEAVPVVQESGQDD